METTETVASVEVVDMGLRLPEAVAREFESLALDFKVQAAYARDHAARVASTTAALPPPSPSAAAEQPDKPEINEERPPESVFDDLRAALQDAQGILLNGLPGVETAEERIDAADARISGALDPPPAQPEEQA